MLLKRLFPLTLLLFSLLTITNGQQIYDLNFQGRLMDKNGQGVGAEEFNLKVQLKPASKDVVLYEFSSLTRSDEQGMFGFTIKAISNFLSEGGGDPKAVRILMEFRPAPGTSWLRQDEEFMVSYTLIPVAGNNANKFKMTRLEGSELFVHFEDHLYAFKDQSPFAYLVGGFLLTDKLPISSQSIDDLRQWLSPDLQPSDAPASRGVKGGFPKGGYYRKH